MPPVVAAAVVAGASALVAKGTILAAAIAFGSTLVLGLVTQALAPKPPRRGASLGGRLETVRQPAVPRQIVYGRSRKGGVFAYISTSGKGNRYLHMAVALAGHRVEEIGAVYFNGEKAFEANGDPVGDIVGPLGSARAMILKRLGADSQTAITPAEFAAEVDRVLAATGSGRPALPDEWTSDHRLRGVAYIYVLLDWNGERFAGGIPNVTADVKGRNQIYDPRSQTSGYSENAALCVADYMANSRWGLGMPIGGQDGIDEDELIAAANVCDEMVPLADGVGEEPRYLCNGTFALDAEPQNIIESLLTAMAGRAAWRGGAWHIIAGAYRTPVMTISEADVRQGGLTLATRVSRSENFNAVSGTFISPDNDWQPDDFPGFKAPLAIAEDGEEVWTDVELPFTISADAAQRLAKIHVMRARMQQTLQAASRLRAYGAPAGETIAVERAQWGFAQKPFEVRGLTLHLEEGGDGAAPVLVTDLLLRETSPLVFDSQASEFEVYEAAPRTNLPSAFTVPAPTGIILESGAAHLYLRQDGTVISRLYVAWDDPEGTVTETHIQYRIGDSGPWQQGPIAPGGEVDAYIFDINDTANYQVRIQHRNIIGARSVWVVTSLHEMVAKLTPPGPVTNLVATGGWRQIALGWDNPTDRDFAWAEIWENDADDRATAVRVARVSGNSFVRTGIEGQTVQRWYWARAVDRSGNIGDWNSVEGTHGVTLLLDEDDLDQSIRDLLDDLEVQAIPPVYEFPGAGSPLRVHDKVILYVPDQKLYRFDEDAHDGAAEPGEAAGGDGGWVPVHAVVESEDIIGQIVGEQLADASIGAAKLMFTFDNLVPDPDFSRGGDGWLPLQPSESWEFVADETNAAVGKHVARVTYNGSSSTRVMELAIRVPVMPGETFAIKAQLKVGADHEGSGLRLHFVWWDADGGLISGDLSVPVTSTTYEEVIHVSSAPAGAVQGSLRVLSAGHTAGTAYCGRVLFNRQTAAELIGDGTITETAIADGSISTPKLQALAITADRLAANAVVAGKVAANAIGAEQIAAGAIIAEKIAANAVTAAKIAADAVTAAKIAAGAITAAKIASNAITAAKIAADAVTAGAIAAGAVTATAMAANAITAANAALANASVVTAKIANLAVTSAKIGSLAVTTAKINDLAVNSLKIADNSVTIMSQSYTSGSISILDGDWRTVQSVTHQSTGGEVMVMFTGVATVTASTGSITLTFRLRRNTTSIISEATVAAHEPGTTDRVTMAVSRRDAPSSGSVTYDLDMRYSGSAGTQSASIIRRSLVILERIK